MGHLTLVCARTAILSLAGLAVFAASQPASAQKGGEGKDLVAVLEFQAVGATKNQTAAMSERLREELLATGKFRIVEREQMDKVLDEQALQQTGCTSQDCAVQVGRVLGVRKLIAGKLNRVEDDLWFISCTLVDVETAETLKAVSLQQEGAFRVALADGAAKLVDRLLEGATGAARLAPAPKRAGVSTLDVLGVKPDDEVFLNGTAKGRGPQRFENLLPGEYKVVVKSKDFRPWSESVHMAAGEDKQVTATHDWYRLAVFPIRMNGTWSSGEDFSRAWVSRSVGAAAAESRFRVTHGSHVNMGDRALAEDPDALKNSWTFFGNPDQEYLRRKGKTLGDDLAMTLVMNSGAGGSGTWTATLIDVASGRSRTATGNWPWSDRAGPAVTKGLSEFMSQFVAE